MQNPEYIRRCLFYHYGSETLHRFSRLVPNFLITDGVKDVMEMCEAVWLVSEIMALSCKPKIRRESFVVWELKLDGNRATLTADDGNGNKLTSEKIPYTDFPLPEGIKFYLCDNVLLLPNEY